MRSTRVVAVVGVLLAAACSSSTAGAKDPRAPGPAPRSLSLDALASDYIEADQPVQDATDRFYSAVGGNVTNLQVLSAAVPLVTALKTFDGKILALPTSGQLRVDIQGIVSADAALESDLSSVSLPAGQFQKDSATAGAAYAKVRDDLGLTAASSPPPASPSSP